MFSTAPDSEIILALLTAIASHPLIQNPPIYLDNIQQKIVKFRDYGGQELSEGELTLAVYAPNDRPLYTASPYTMGNSRNGSQVQNRWMVKIALFYLLADYDTPETVYWESSQVWNPQVAWGDQGESVNAPTLLDGESAFNTEIDTEISGGDASSTATNSINAGDSNVKQVSVEIQTVPAETILKQYSSLLKLVINDLVVVRPQLIRNPQVTAVYLPTSNLFEQDGTSVQRRSLVFHRMVMDLEFDTYEVLERSSIPVDSICVSQKSGNRVTNFQI